MAKVTVYYKVWCGYCVRAMALLDSKSVDYKKIDVEVEGRLEKEMVERSGGVGTVPQIFIDDRHIGGSDELHAMDEAGELDSLLGI
jgi:glutaredoxin 3